MPEQSLPCSTFSDKLSADFATYIRFLRAYFCEGVSFQLNPMTAASGGHRGTLIDEILLCSVTWLYF
jgi:hypothetical protein